MLHEVTLRRHRAGARARHGGANGMNFGAPGGGIELCHGQPPADVIRVHRGMLQTQLGQGRFQLLRVAASDRVDEHQRCRARFSLFESNCGSERSQILYGVVGTCQGCVPGQVCERAVEFAAVRTLLRAAAAECVQLRGSGSRAQPQMGVSQC